MTRIATCQCGQLSLACDGEPARVSVCHCLDCQKRSGAPFAAQARFPAEQVTVSGTDKVWERTAESGNTSEHHFCPECGSEVWYVARPFLEMMAIPVGRFADPEFPPPEYSVYEVRRHPWVAVVGEGIEHYD
ncbi:GFA family protein [Qipengyuania algicida]|uniref:GFA family protein n=1 Tax=Qipengyuania algicida TaxID=1836209 RepID=UPI00301BE0A3